MAVGAITIVGLQENAGSQRKVVADVVGGASYTTGGDTLSPSAFGLTAIQDGIAFVTAAGATNSGADPVVLAQADGSAKLKLFTQAGTAEYGSAASYANNTFRVTLYGY